MRTSTHFVVDLSPSGLDTDNEVFHADDCPCGLIGAVLADDATPDPAPPRIPYPLLNDSELRLASDAGLPTFEAGGMTLYKRLTLIARAGRIAKVFYPVFPPDRNARDVAEWLSKAR